METENNFLMFKARAYGWLESELALFKVEYDNMTHQKQELAEMRQQAQHYRTRALQLKQDLKEETQRRMMCEVQIQIMTDIYDQQSIEQNKMQQQIAVLQHESTEYTRLAQEERDKYVNLHESSLANGQELDRLKQQIDELSNIAATATAAQLELLAANEKVAALERENDILTNDITQHKARIVQLEMKDQESSISDSESCAEMVNNISEPEPIIAGLKDVSTATVPVACEENSNILQRVTNLAKALLETVEQGDRSPASNEHGADGAQLSTLITQLAEKDEIIKQLQDKMDAMVVIGEEVGLTDTAGLPDEEDVGSVGKLKELENYITKRCTLASVIGGELATGIELDCIKAIALKIAQGGLEMLLVAELYVLLQEICSAITRKNAMLGRNVSSLANSMTKCWQLITDARVTMNREFLSRTIRRTTWNRH